MSDYLADKEIADLGFERTRRGWVPIPAGRTEGEQLSILEGRRFDPTSVAVKLLLPHSFSRTHGIAAALGNSIRKDGTRLPLRNGKDVIGVLIPPSKRKRICAVMRIGPKHFSAFAAECERLAIGHRCQRGTLCLWIVPLMERCPAPGCGKEVLLSEGNESPNQRDSSPESEGQTVPVGGDALRDGKGDAL
jgi:hypothetical protein